MSFCFSLIVCRLLFTVGEIFPGAEEPRAEGKHSSDSSLCEPSLSQEVLLLGLETQVLRSLRRPVNWRRMGQRKLSADLGFVSK